MQPYSVGDLVRVKKNLIHLGKVNDFYPVSVTVEGQQHDISIDTTGVVIALENEKSYYYSYPGMVYIVWIDGKGYYMWNDLIELAAAFPKGVVSG